MDVRAFRQGGFGALLGSILQAEADKVVKDEVFVTRRVSKTEMEVRGRRLLLLLLLLLLLFFFFFFFFFLSATVDCKRSAQTEVRRCSPGLARRGVSARTRGYAGISVCAYNHRTVEPLAVSLSKSALQKTKHDHYK